MALEFLSIDFSSKRELHRDPTWVAARDAIDLLDGESISMIRLSTLAGTSLSIGGGQEGRYVVSGVRCSGVSTSLLDPLNVGSEVHVRTGRTTGVFPACMVVPKEMVLRAADVFWRNGNFDTSLSWQMSERKAS